MTSPTTKSSEKVQTPVKKFNASPVAADPSMDGINMLPPSSARPHRECRLFSWMKVFRYADLLTRQGC